ncbi:MAG: DNA polymerase III subunit gamma/tau [Helicobacteraceae bacterium]|jgi:DNA polymerase-3 subunit gamma/tau|nr:DNA polymerase III subunit gamma/tau [Helicobacteraceae bacterium]
MENYKVLALKYRPRSFKELIGQEAVSQTLSAALENGKLSHAYLFSGLRGSGKTSSARIFAKSLLCEKGVSAAPCDQCDSCKNANEGRHIDIVEMDAASNTSVNDIRDLIEQTRYAPAAGRFKVYIIDEAHMLSNSAFNAFLKTLEEPPPHAKFLLATTDPQKLPLTVLSRVQHFRFKKIAYEAVLAHIRAILAQENITADEKALEMIARAGGGSMRDTLTILEQTIAFGRGAVTLESAIDILGALDPARIESFFDAVLEGKTDEATLFVKEFESDDAEMIVSEMINFLKDRLFKPRPRFTHSIIERFFKTLAETRSMLRHGADSGFALALAAMKMIEALRPEAINDAIERLENEIENMGDLNANQPVGAASAKPAAQISPAASHAIPPVSTAIRNSAPAAPAAITATKTPSPKELFEIFKRKLYDRGESLGSAAEAVVTFVDFADGEILLKFAKEGEAADRLRSDYKIFRQIAAEVFGAEAKIAPVKDDEPSGNTNVLDDPALKKAVEIFGSDIEKITPLPKSEQS